MNNISIKNWAIEQSINKSKRTIILSILCTLLFASGIRFLVIDDDMMKMLPKEIDSRIAWENVQQEFGSTEVIFISYGHFDQNIYNKTALSDLWELTIKLRELSSVYKIKNLSTATKIDNIDGFMEVSDIQPYKTLSEANIEEIKVYLAENPILKNQFVSKNGDYLITIIQPRDNIGLDEFRNQVVSVADNFLNGYDIHYGGAAYITGSIPKLIRDDIRSLLVAGILIMVVVLLLNLRNLKAVFLVMVVITTSLIAMIGFNGWAYKITGSDRFLFAILNTSMPIILLTIANSDGVHVMTRFFREMRKNNNVKFAVQNSMDALFLPIFLTSLTTIAAFLTMTASPLEPLVGYGISLSVGITWAWLMSSFMLPSILMYLKWDVDSNAIAVKSLFENFVEYIASKIISYPRYIFLSGVVLVCFGLLGLSKIKVDVNIASFFKVGTEIRDSMDFMDKEMSGTMDLRVLVEGDIKDPDILKKMDSIQTFISTNEHIGVSYSIADVVKRMHQVIMDDSAEYAVVPQSKDKVSNLFSMYSVSGNPDELSDLVAHDFSSALITSFSSAMSTDEVFKFVQSVNNMIDQNMLEKLQVDVTGMIVVLRDMVNLIIRSSLLSIVLSVIFIGLISAVFFRRMIWGMLAILPLSCAIVLNFGLMGHFNITLNHITAILSSIIIGVGVDFAIHFISEFQRLSKKVDKNILNAEVIREVGYPIILDACSNMGFGSLLFSSFVPVGYIGGLMLLAMISTSFGTLVLLSSSIEIKKHYLVIEPTQK